MLGGIGFVYVLAINLGLWVTLIVIPQKWILTYLLATLNWVMEWMNWVLINVCKT